HEAIIATGTRLEGISHLESPAFYNRRSLLERHALYLPMNCLRFVTDLVGICLTMMAMAVLLSELNVLIPCVMVLSATPDVLSQIRAHQLRYEGIKATAEEERRKDYYRSVLLEAQCAKEVRIYSLKDYFMCRYAESVERILQLVSPIRERQLRASLWS